MATSAKRILYISPGTGLGGGEFSLLTLIANLDRTQYEPIVCAYGEGAFAERARALNLTVHVLTYTHPLSQALFIFKLRRLIHETRADLVHVNTLDIRAGIATKWAHRPLVGHLRVIFPTTWVDRTFVNLASKTISVSNAARDYICEKQGNTPDQFVTIYNAVDIQNQNEEPTNIRQELNLPEYTPLLGVVGRIDPWKGMETFIEAAKKVHTKHPKAHFLIAGSPGPSHEEQQYAETLYQTVAASKIKNAFHFLGFRADALNIIRQLDTLVVPSKVLETPEGIKTEGFGRVAAEGLAMQTPVVASRVGGLPEIIQEPETGFLFESENVDELAAHLDNLLGDPTKRTTIAQAGYIRFQDEFSVKQHLAQIQDLYGQLLS